MKFKVQKLSLFPLFFFCLFVKGQEFDQDRYSKILQQLKLQASEIHNELYVEKKMPNLEDSFIVVVPVLQSPIEVDGFTVKITVLITDSVGNIKNKFEDKNEFGSDAYRLESFGIDTGIYNVAKNIRAFGVKTYYRGSSQPNPSSSVDIELYYPYENTLIKILDYPLNSFHGEWDTNCNGQFHEETSLIVLGKEKTNGFVNLIIKTKSSETVSELINGECIDSVKSKVTSKTLRFIKGMYQ